MGSVCVSSCRWCVFVHTVVIIIALFCVTCSLLMFVADANVDHMMETYSSMGLVIALYVARIVSLCFPMLLMCFEYRYCLTCFCSCGFYVFRVCEFGVESQSSYFGLMFMGSIMLSNCS